MFKPTKMTDQENVFMALTAKAIEAIRTNAKRQQANLIRHIETHCNEKGSRTAVYVHRQHLVQSQELTRMNVALAAKMPEENVADYQRELDDRVAACFLFIDRYLQSRIGDTLIHVSARSSRQSDRPWASQTPSQAERVRLARNRREVVELELEALIAVEALETRRLQDQEADATMAEARRRGVEPGGDAYDEKDGDIDEAAEDDQLYEEGLGVPVGGGNTFAGPQQSSHVFDVIAVDVNCPQFGNDSNVAALVPIEATSPVRAAPSHLRPKPNRRPATDAATTQQRPMIPLRSTFCKPAITKSLSPALTPPTGVFQPQVKSDFANTKDGIVAMADEWMGASDSATTRMPPWNGLAACLPKVTLDVYDGDPILWYDFIGNFKAYCHDVTPIAAQRMQLLKSYLSPRVRSNIAQHLRNPSKYTEALQALQRLYGNRRLIDRANVGELMGIPAMKNCTREQLSIFSAKLPSLSETKAFAFDASALFISDETAMLRRQPAELMIASQVIITTFFMVRRGLWSV